MTTLVGDLTIAFQAVGADFKALLANQGALTGLSTTAKNTLVTSINELKGKTDGIGTLGNLTTTDKTSLVAAIVELKASLSAYTQILDTATDATHTWSALQIQAKINAGISALVAGAPTALDTLKEISDLLSADDTAITGLIAAVGNRLRFDAAQALTAAQQLTAQTNLGLGDCSADLLAVYVAAKA